MKKKKSLTTVWLHPLPDHVRHFYKEQIAKDGTQRCVHCIKTLEEGNHIQAKC